MIKAIMFDWGGVISTQGTFKEFFERFGPKWGINSEEMRIISRKIWNQARVNEIPSSAYWEGCAKEYGVTKELFRKELVNYMGFNPATVELLKKLKRKYTLVLLSNQIEDWLEEKIVEQGLDNIFDIFNCSYKVGYAKPDPNIYRVALEKLDAKPEECVYIDDVEAYLKPARDMGIKTIQFKNAEQVEKDLVALGVNV